MNFSWIGILVGMLLFGTFWKAIYIYRKRNPSLGTNLVYSLTLSLMFPWIRGSSFGPTVLYIMLLLPLGIAFKYMTCQKGRHSNYVE